MEIYDAIVVGGSFAGLSAAMQLARARRTVLVVDAGKPRNRFAAASHGFFGQDGRPPHAILATAREQVLAYPTAAFRQAEATHAVSEDCGFTVTFGEGGAAHAKRLVLATGVTDHLPEIPGLRELWGSTVIHCPYCHGYEVAERRFAILGAGPNSVHQAILTRDWSGDVTLLTQGGEWLTLEDRAQLEARGIAIDTAPLARLISTGKDLEAIEFEDGRRVPYGAMFIAPRVTLTSPLAVQLGCEIEQGMMGPMIKINELKETTISGVFAAGDAARQMHNATFASADGVMAGVGAHRSMIWE